MNDETMVIFTAKSIEDCFRFGGSQSWVLDRVNAKRCTYAVLCRNAHNKRFGGGKEPHGTAFLIGHISDVVPSTEVNGRWLVKFDQYALLDIPNFWHGWRNPVRYTTLEELALSLDDLHFEPMPEIARESAMSAPIGANVSGGMTIAEAKKGLAIAFGVEPEAVEIIIHG
ncbi:MAG: hypothetical protein ACLPN1_08080 [Dissulfurispiraceae bacterium]